MILEDPPTREDPLDNMFEEVDDSGRSERGKYSETVALAIPPGIQREAN